MIRIAVIDIGTNSTRLLVANVSEESGVDVLHGGLVTTRLGEGIGEGRLVDAAMGRTIKAIKGFIEDAGKWQVDKVVAAATSAVRDAANREDFLERVQRETGVRVAILSGSEEAKYSYVGAMSGLPLDPAETVVMDVGGGSTEFIWRTGEDIKYCSLNVGAVRMTEGGYSDNQICEIMQPVLKNIRSNNPTGSPGVLVGVGGTVTTLAAMDQRMEVYNPALVHGYRLNISQVEEIMDVLGRTDLQGRRMLPGLQPQRADIIPAGVKIVRFAMLGLGISTLWISEADILHGLALHAGLPVERKSV